jgi:CRISPR/Cas system-associated endoribonuclease Cas2
VIQPVFDGEMNFQEYLEIKALFKKVIKPKNLSTTEYILKNN